MRASSRAAAPINENAKEGVRVLGPAEAPLALIRGRHRMRLLLKAARNYDLSAYLRRLARQGAEAARHHQARHRRRPAEFFVRYRMTETIQTMLLLLGVLVVVGVAARRLNTPPSILLVVAGIVLAIVPDLPRIELAPELVLLGILPPLIYSAGVAMSWREFKFSLRPIALFAFGGVVFTTCAVAAAAYWLLGMPLAVGFVLGAIVSPPDAVAPLAIVRRLGLPRRLVVILEGEGLANDATALILYRFAVAAVSTGLFSLDKAGGDLCADRRRRDRLWHRRRLGELAGCAAGRMTRVSKSRCR